MSDFFSDFNWWEFAIGAILVGVSLLIGYYLGWHDGTRNQHR